MTTQRKRKKRWWLWAVPAVVLVLLVAIVAVARGSGSKIDPSKLAKATRGDIAKSVVATGKIQPITKVELKSKASGLVEKLFVDITVRKDLSSFFVAVSRKRGQQLKEPGQLDSWVRDGSAEFVNSLADWL